MLEVDLVWVWAWFWHGGGRGRGCGACGTPGGGQHQRSPHARDLSPGAEQDKAWRGRRWVTTLYSSSSKCYPRIYLVSPQRLGKGRGLTTPPRLHCVTNVI
ncbi:hypothetical protein Pmani_015348 [Petrolisthes manimaculis]|uniref:Secreted protein n=1 Tax=Petrolisthes manimaculis TaxID=1843537 RepID=A0AAE1UC51_9EUCA|nr:hypothetical protein Pmani_015348 [Petrolisthes manimaculis]